MEYVEFLEAIEARLRNQLGETVEIDKQHLLKNNVRKEVMTIKVGNQCATPCIPLDSLYGMYQLGETLETIIDKVVAVVVDNPNIKTDDLNKLSEWDYVKDFVECRIINTKNNEEFLADSPHMEYLDCSIVYYVKMDDFVWGKGYASIKVTEQHRSMWGVSVETLDEYARKNNEKNEITFQSMEEILAETLALELEECSEAKRNFMYVLSNVKRQYAAVALINKDVLQSAYEKLGESYYILPSSIHELILMPSTVDLEVQEMKEMVSTINETEVEPEEVLSDSIYYYDGGEVTIVA